MVWTLTRVHYDQEAAGGRQTWRVCRRCLLRGPLPALFVYSLPFTAKSLLLWNIFHADVDYQSLFCANFTLRDIVWGNVDETRRLCLFAYNVIRGLWRMEWFMEYCEGVYHDNLQIFSTTIYNYLLRKQIHASIFKKEIYRFFDFYWILFTLSCIPNCVLRGNMDKTLYEDWDTIFEWS